jgi:hypothetical protein
LGSDQWFAAREPNLTHTDFVEGTDERLNFFEREEFLAAKELKIPTKDFLWHAVDTAKIAAIRNGYAQVVERSRECVCNHE